MASMNITFKTLDGDSSQVDIPQTEIFGNIINYVGNLLKNYKARKITNVVYLGFNYELKKYYSTKLQDVGIKNNSVVYLIFDNKNPMKHVPVKQYSGKSEDIEDVDEEPVITQTLQSLQALHNPHAIIQALQALQSMQDPQALTQAIEQTLQSLQDPQTATQTITQALQVLQSLQDQQDPQAMPPAIMQAITQTLQSTTSFAGSASPQAPIATQAPQISQAAQNAPATSVNVFKKKVNLLVGPPGGPFNKYNNVKIYKGSAKPIPLPIVESDSDSSSSESDSEDDVIENKVQNPVNSGVPDSITNVPVPSNNSDTYGASIQNSDELTSIDEEHITQIMDTLDDYDVDKITQLYKLNNKNAVQTINALLDSASS